MTRNEIIEMATQAGLCYTVRNYEDWIDGGPAGMELEKFAELVAAHERDAIAEEYWSAIFSDLEHGVKCLNIQAAKDFNKTMPELRKFGTWLNERGEK